MSSTMPVVCERYLKVSEAADVARLTQNRVRQLLRERRLVGVRPAGRGSWRIPTSSIDRFLAGRDSTGL